MVALMVRFQAVPNYIQFYDWVGNVSWIIQSTPSWRDMIPIIWEEWLIEIGFMNYDYGTGISEWSLNVIPSRLVVMFIMGRWSLGASPLSAKKPVTSGHQPRCAPQQG